MTPPDITTADGRRELAAMLATLGDDPSTGWDACWRAWQAAQQALFAALDAKEAR